MVLGSMNDSEAAAARAGDVARIFSPISFHIAKRFETSAVKKFLNEMKHQVVIKGTRIKKRVK